MPKVSEIDRAANGTVTYASEGFVYDSNGYLANLKDWNGNNTSYVNNSHGLPTQIVYASTTADAETTNITYDSTWVRLPKTINRQGLNSSMTYDSSGNLTYISATDMTTQSRAVFDGRHHADLGVYVERHRPAADRAAAAHGCDGEDHVRLHRRHADQRHGRARQHHQRHHPTSPAAAR